MTAGVWPTGRRRFDGGRRGAEVCGCSCASTREQSLDRQLDALAAFGVDEVFADFNCYNYVRFGHQMLTSLQRKTK